MNGLAGKALGTQRIGGETRGTLNGMVQTETATFFKKPILLGIKCTNQNTAVWQIPSINMNGGTITFAMWLYPTSFPSSLGFLFGIGTYFFEFTNAGLLQYVINNTQRAFGATGQSSLTLKLNQWNHIVFQIDSSGFFLVWRNGILVGKNTSATLAALGLTWTNGTQDFLGFGTNQNVVGTVAEVAMWKVPYVTPATGTNNTGTYVMPGNKIRKLMNRQTNMPLKIDRAYLQFYYKMNDLGANSTAKTTSKLRDYSGQGRTGVNFGGASANISGTYVPQMTQKIGQ